MKPKVTPNNLIDVYMNNGKKEITFILNCLTNKINNQSELDLLKKINWQKVLNLSQLHQVAPFIYKKYQHLIPQKILSVFKNAYLKTININLRFWNEFCCIKEILEKNNVKIIPLKGIIFADLLYKDIGLRPMGDIDILVKEQEVGKAKELISSFGYEPHLLNKPEWYWRKYLHHLCFINRSKSMYIELHWAFAPARPYKIEMSNIWQRAKINKIENNDTLCLTFEDMLLSLCLEMCKIVNNLQFTYLKNLCDIDLIIKEKQDKFDYQYIIQKIREWHLMHSLYYIYKLSEKNLGARWPTEITHQFKIGIIRKKIINLFASKLKYRSRLTSYFLMLILTDTFKEQVTLILQRFETYFQLLKINLKRSLKTR